MTEFVKVRSWHALYEGNQLQDRSPIGSTADQPCESCLRILARSEPDDVIGEGQE